MKSYLLHILLLISITISCQNRMEEKFEWLPTESAPELYPMNIYKGNLYFEDGKSVYIPSSLIAHNGWGNSGSTHTQGEDLKPVPVKLEITWASFTENKFYTGSWDLPKEKMLKLFQEGVVWYGTRKKETYRQILVGCAPGGVVVVWMRGAEQQVEIARFQARETKIAMSDYVPENPSITQKEYFDISKEVPEALENIKKKGGIQYGLWDSYRKKYTWRTRIEIPNYTFDNTSYEMFNGEMEELFDESLKKNEFKERAVPKLLDFIIADAQGKRTVWEFKYLDEEEIMGLFKQANPNIPIEIVLRMNKDFTNRSLIFKQGEKEIPIKKIDLDNMWEYE
ncbi:hypothetical protein AB670_04297 [Chryseobacterium sp. MOF25P]|nr:DUF2931 family protein [Chryseobacterium sp. BGARF1]OBW39363.1 hypothetical protein AB670_04297 [Chryseobacterium sp. MOF25P]OBW45238.1 hypothetical protein AB671_02671 [Chryseobacterium sp. BGARF1]